MGTLIATIFTVIAVAVSSVFVSNQLSNSSSVAPNAPESKPAASECKPCADDEKGQGKDSKGCYICVKNGSSGSSQNNNSNSSSNSSCSGASSASFCKNKSVGDSECVGGVILKCSRTSGQNCSAYDTGVKCGTASPTTAITGTSPTISKSQTKPVCACLDGVYVGDGCGAKDGKKCASSSTSNNSTSSQETRAEMKDCQVSGGTWSNGNCAYSTHSTVNTTSSRQDTSCACLDGVYVGDGCGAKDGKKCASNPTVEPSHTSTPTNYPDDPSEDRRRGYLCDREGGVWVDNRCIPPYKKPSPSVGASPTPTPTVSTLPPPRSLDNYSDPTDSQTFANVTNEIAEVLYSCQKSGNISGIALRNCFCDSVDCRSESGETIADQLFSTSSDGNGLQCVEFVSALEILQKNASTSNCNNAGAVTASQLASCNEPGYLRCPGGQNNSNFHDGDIVVWEDGGIGGQEGHIAICVEASADGQSCTVAESNWAGDQKVGFRTISATATPDENNYSSVLRRTDQENQSCY